MCSGLAALERNDAFIFNTYQLRNICILLTSLTAISCYRYVYHIAIIALLEPICRQHRR